MRLALVGTDSVLELKILFLPERPTFGVFSGYNGSLGEDMSPDVLRSYSALLSATVNLREGYFFCVYASLDISNRMRALYGKLRLALNNDVALGDDTFGLER